MLFQVSYSFNSKDDPDEGFFNMLDEIGPYRLGFDGFLLLDAPYTARGLKEIFDEYFLLGKRGRYFIGRTVRDCSGCLHQKDKAFISRRWDRVPPIENLGKLPRKAED